MSSEIDGFSDLVSKLTTIEKLSKSIEKSWGVTSSSAKSASKVTMGGAGGGQKQLGGGKGVTESSMGTFSGGQGNFQPKGMLANALSSFAQRNGQTTAGGGTSQRTTATFNGGGIDQTASGGGGGVFGIGDILDLGRTVNNSVAQFMPGVKSTMNRATSYYNAGIYGGSAMSRRDLQSATYGTMAKMNGITSTGSDANVAQFLAGRGMTASKDQGSTYQQTLRTVSNAARYMNISNEEAAASVEGMTSAKGAAETLRNFGIYTADLGTGKEKTQTQIFEELAQRLTAGRGQASVEQTQQSIRRGALGVTIEGAFGNDQQGAQMFKQYMIERARSGGKGGMDFAAGTQADKALGNAGNYNPLNAQMTLNQKETGALDRAEPEYIKGINAATGALAALTDVSGHLAEALGGANAMMQTLFGSDRVKGIASGLTGVVNYGAKGIGSAVSQIATGSVPGAFAGAATLGAMTAGAAGVFATGFVAEGAATMFGGNGNVTGGTGGGNVGALSGQRLNSGGEVSGGGAGASMTPMFDTSYAAKFRVTTVLGVNDADHKQSGGHHGTDYGMSRNTPVKAVGDGVVAVAKGNITRESNANDGLGNHVIIHHQASNGDKYTSIYAHLIKVYAKVGNKVSKGDVIGLSGNTGHSTGPHLHQEINKGWHNNNSGTPVPPAVANRILSSGSTLEGTALEGEAGAASSGSNGMDANGLATDTAVAAAKKKYGDMLQPSSAATGSLSILQGLYSQDKKKISAALATIGKNLGMKEGVMEQAISAGASGNLDAIAPVTGSIGSNVGIPGAPGSGGGATNNNVSIVVQVPDVTSADAAKFAQLVKQYLDNDSLMSNTGSI